MQQTNLDLGIIKDDDRSIAKLVKPCLLPKKDRELVHKLFSYPAKFQGHLPATLIENLTNENALICDPYSGGGTTVAAAALAGRKAYGIDLNPLAVLISKSKVANISENQKLKQVSELNALQPLKKCVLLNSDEKLLMGQTLSEVAESIWTYLKKGKCDPSNLVIGTLLIKRIKLTCRRDKTHLRTASFNAHIEYIVEEFIDFCSASNKAGYGKGIRVDYGSNHSIDLKSNSVDLIVTSPPYPGVDVEYNLIQLQRRDLNRCYRSDVGIRIAKDLVQISNSVSKKDLCDGGSAGDYWSNTELSMREMRRVMKFGSLAFLYIGFKTEFERNRFEKLVKIEGLSLESKFTVTLGAERVASSRGLYHGRDTSMMKSDLLYVLRKT